DGIHKISHVVNVQCSFSYGVGSSTGILFFHFFHQIVIIVIDLIYVSIQKHCPFGTVNSSSSTSVEIIKIVAAFSFPGNQLIIIKLITNQLGVGKLPIILKMVASTGRSDFSRIVNTQRPPANVNFMGTIVMNFTCSILPKPVPVVMHPNILVILPRCRTLPQFPVQPLGYRNFLSISNRTTFV